MNETRRRRNEEIRRRNEELRRRNEELRNKKEEMRKEKEEIMGRKRRKIESEKKQVYGKRFKVVSKSLDNNRLIQRSLPISLKKEKKIIGVVEPVIISGNGKNIKTYALIDTGATYSSVDPEIADKLGLCLEKSKIVLIKQANQKGYNARKTCNVKFNLLNQKFNVLTNISDRSNVTLPVIIGRNILKGNFIVDPEINKEMLKFSPKLWETL